MTRDHVNFRRAIRRTVDPVGLPVTLDEIKAQLRIDSTEDDLLLDAMLAAATRHAEQYTRRAFLPQTFVMSLDDFPASRQPWWDGVREISQREITGTAQPFELPFPPLLQVNSITQFGQDDAAFVVPDEVYLVDSFSEPARVSLRFGQTWPSISLRVVDAIRIEYEAGYDVVPADIQRGILMTAAHLYEHRGDCPCDSKGSEMAARASGASALLDAYRVMAV